MELLLLALLLLELLTSLKRRRKLRGTAEALACTLAFRASTELHSSRAGALAGGEGLELLELELELLLLLLLLLLPRQGCTSGLALRSRKPSCARRPEGGGAPSSKPREPCASLATAQVKKG